MVGKKKQYKRPKSNKNRRSPRSLRVNRGTHRKAPRNNYGYDSVIRTFTFHQKVLVKSTSTSTPGTTTEVATFPDKSLNSSATFASMYAFMELLSANVKVSSAMGLVMHQPILVKKRMGEVIRTDGKFVTFVGPSLSTNGMMADNKTFNTTRPFSYRSHGKSVDPIIANDFSAIQTANLNNTQKSKFVASLLLLNNNPTDVTVHIDTTVTMRYSVIKTPLTLNSYSEVGSATLEYEGCNQVKPIVSCTNTTAFVQMEEGQAPVKIDLRDPKILDKSVHVVLYSGSGAGEELEKKFVTLTMKDI
jgi:hypothetical protein